ncbi:MAG: helix-turn-helix domain-containing protein, partial [Clostridiales bacterium]|nr:helix-turn-helix domain-containing protein [Clostridiales bacterium]
RIVLGEQQMMDFELLDRTKEQIIYHYPAIYFVLAGTLIVTVGDKATVLGEKDFLFVNPLEAHAYEMEEDALSVCFLINQDLLASYYDIDKMDFMGNSTEGNPGQCQGFRELLESCVVYYYGKRSGDGRVLLKLNSLFYQMAERILASFTVVRNEQGEDAAGDEALIRDMIHYIQMNYQSQLKLEELAEQFYLSPSYISRFFKKKMGINFGKYLTGIRLDTAVKELEDTQKSLTHIAMDCGFPNLASFNKAFRERYEMNPKQYRETMQREKENSPAPDNSDMAYRLLDYFEQNNTPMEESQGIYEQVEADTAFYTYLNKSWNRMINIGRIAMLLHTAIQNHVLFLRDELDYKYVRIWDLYDPELRIHAENEDHRYNFTRLDMALDFLVSHQLKPYIELGFKPNILLDTFLNYTHYEERKLIFKNGESYGIFIHSLMIHLVNRYGIKEVSEWCFEQWCDPRLFPKGEPDPFFDVFEHAFQTIKSVLPRARVGGDYDRTYKVIDFEKFIERWSMRNVRPDFISVYCYPMVASDADESDDDVNGGYALEKTSLREYLLRQRDVLLKYGMTIPIFVSEWNFTVANYNVLNDSRFKGAYVMQNIMELYQYADSMGYWFGSDLFAEGDDPLKLLNGKCGLITHQAICKPAFWAVKFMNRLENLLLAQSDHAMVTMDGLDSYVIACHNCRPMDIQYYVQKERAITIDSIPALYSDRKSLALRIRIKGVRNGLYHMKVRSVNSEHGGVMDEWIRMGKVAFLNQRDVDYINHISRPRITIEEKMVTDGTLDVATELEAQEIQCIHLFRYIEENI